MTHVYSAHGSRRSAVFAAIIGLHLAVFLIVLNDQIQIDRDKVVDPGPVVVLPPKPLPEKIQRPVAPDPIGLTSDPVEDPKVVVPRIVASQPVPEALGTEIAATGGSTPVLGTVAVAPATLQGRSGHFADAVRACYPAAARRNGEEGRLVLAIVIGSQGRVRSWRTAQGTGFPRLDAAAACVLDKLQFNAAREDGRAIESEVLLPIVFRLD